MPFAFTARKPAALSGRAPQPLITVSAGPLSPEPAIFARQADEAHVASICQSQRVSPLQGRIIASRLGQAERFVVNSKWEHIPNYASLVDVDIAAQRIVRAIYECERIAIFHDYDMDGASAGAILHRALLSFGANPDRVSRVVGDRHRDGYGLTQNAAERMACSVNAPSLIITADCGSADEERVAFLKRYHIETIVTDHHHIPGDAPLRSTVAFVNPNRRDCLFADKSIAGCAVAFLLMVAVRDALIADGHDIPSIADLVAFVACGTVADCVDLSSPANRAFVRSGLHVMNDTESTHACWKVFRERLNLANDEYFRAEHIGFGIGPRINSASRVADANIMAQFLMCDDLEQARLLSCSFEMTNDARKQIEQTLKASAMSIAIEQRAAGAAGLCVFLEEGHPGVHGIVASRLVQAFGSPTVMFSPKQDEPELLSGSGRSVPGVDLMFALTQIKARYPGLVLKGGGHKGAFGCTIARNDIDRFREAFDESIKYQQHVQQLSFAPSIVTDGELLPVQLSLNTVHEIERIGPYGHGFEKPTFLIGATISGVKPMGQGQHYRIEFLDDDFMPKSAVWFNAAQCAASQHVMKDARLWLVGSLNINRYNGNTSLQIQIESVIPRV